MELMKIDFLPLLADVVGCVSSSQKGSSVNSKQTSGQKSAMVGWTLSGKFETRSLRLLELKTAFSRLFRSTRHSSWILHGLNAAGTWFSLSSRQSCLCYFLITSRTTMRLKERFSRSFVKKFYSLWPTSQIST
jgi:hypothetical protein